MDAGSSVEVGSRETSGILDSHAGKAQAGRLDVVDSFAQVVDMPAADTGLGHVEDCLWDFAADVDGLAQGVG